MIYRLIAALLTESADEAVLFSETRKSLLIFMCVALVGIVIQRTKCEWGVLSQGKGSIDLRFHAESSPMNDFELIDVSDTSNKPKVRQVWFRGAGPRIARGANGFFVSLIREKRITHWPWISDIRTVWHAASGEIRCHLAYA